MAVKETGAQAVPSCCAARLGEDAIIGSDKEGSPINEKCILYPAVA